MMKFNVRCGVLDEKVEMLEDRGENDESEFVGMVNCRNLASP